MVYLVFKNIIPCLLFLVAATTSFSSDEERNDTLTHATYLCAPKDCQESDEEFLQRLKENGLWEWFFNQDSKPNHVTDEEICNSSLVTSFYLLAIGQNQDAQHIFKMSQRKLEQLFYFDNEIKNIQNSKENTFGKFKKKVYDVFINLLQEHLDGYDFVMSSLLEKFDPSYQYYLSLLDYQTLQKDLGLSYSKIQSRAFGKNIPHYQVTQEFFRQKTIDHLEKYFLDVSKEKEAELSLKACKKLIEAYEERDKATPFQEKDRQILLNALEEKALQLPGKNALKQEFHPILMDLYYHRNRVTPNQLNAYRGMAVEKTLTGKYGHGIEWLRAQAWLKNYEETEIPLYACWATPALLATSSTPDQHPNTDGHGPYHDNVFCQKSLRCYQEKLDQLLPEPQKKAIDFLDKDILSDICFHLGHLCVGLYRDYDTAYYHFKKGYTFSEQQCSLYKTYYALNSLVETSFHLGVIDYLKLSQAQQNDRSFNKNYHSLFFEAAKRSRRALHAYWAGISQIRYLPDPKKSWFWSRIIPCNKDENTILQKDIAHYDRHRLHWIAYAASRGLAHAQFYLGQSYLGETGQDPNKAARWFKRVIHNKDADETLKEKAQDALNLLVDSVTKINES